MISAGGSVWGMIRSAMRYDSPSRRLSGGLGSGFDDGFVARIELRVTNDQNPHFANRTMDHSGRDGDCHERSNRGRDGIQFDGRVRTALENDVNFGVMLVGMRESVPANLR